MPGAHHQRCFAAMKWLATVCFHVVAFARHNSWAIITDVSTDLMIPCLISGWLGRKLLTEVSRQWVGARYRCIKQEKDETEADTEHRNIVTFQLKSSTIGRKQSADIDSYVAMQCSETLLKDHLDSKTTFHSPRKNTFYTEGVSISRPLWFSILSPLVSITAKRPRLPQN